MMFRILLSTGCTLEELGTEPAIKGPWQDQVEELISIANEHGARPWRGPLAVAEVFPRLRSLQYRIQPALERVWRPVRSAQSLHTLRVADPGHFDAALLPPTLTVLDLQVLDLHQTECLASLTRLVVLKLDPTFLDQFSSPGALEQMSQMVCWAELVELDLGWTSNRWADGVLARLGQAAPRLQVMRLVGATAFAASFRWQGLPRLEHVVLSSPAAPAGSIMPVQWHGAASRIELRRIRLVPATCQQMLRLCRLLVLVDVELVGWGPIERLEVPLTASWLCRDMSPDDQQVLERVLGPAR